MPASEPLELTFDIDTLELGDLEILEDVTGIEPMELIADLQRKSEEGKNPSLKVLMAIVLINLRRTNPLATLDDARHTRFTDLKFKQTTVSVDPTGPETAPATPGLPDSAQADAEPEATA